MKEKYTIHSFCLVCKNGMQYPYGRHYKEGDTQAGTCSKTCETTYEGAQREITDLALAVDVDDYLVQGKIPPYVVDHKMRTYGVH